MAVQEQDVLTVILLLILLVTIVVLVLLVKADAVLLRVLYNAQVLVNTNVALRTVKAEVVVLLVLVVVIMIVVLADVALLLCNSNITLI